MAMTLAFDGGKATGTAAMGGPAQPIAVDIGGPLFADGPAAFRSIAALPLKDGYTVTFRNFDMMKQKPALKQAEGERDGGRHRPGRNASRRGRSRSSPPKARPGDQTIWVDATSRRIVKVTAILPEMGGAVATMELQK